MNKLVLPKTRKILAQGNYGSYEIGPVLSSVSRVLAIALRRVLLSSLPGAAITSVQIEGVLHEFQDVLHVKEDATDIVQNLKKIRLRNYANHAVTVYLDVQGEGIVTASDMRVPGTIEIVNPEAHIATLDNENAHLFMRMTVDVGRGFVEASVPEGVELPRGVMLVDAIYSPLVHVNFTIERARGVLATGRDVLDVITLEITTDGAISPDEALRQSAGILSRQFAVFAKGKYERDTPCPFSQVSDELIPPHIYAMPLSRLGLSTRTYNVLSRHGIHNMGVLLEMGEDDILMMQSLGTKRLQEITDRLRAHNLLPKVTI